MPKSWVTQEILNTTSLELAPVVRDRLVKNFPNNEALRYVTENGYGYVGTYAMLNPYSCSCGAYPILSQDSIRILETLLEASALDPEHPFSVITEKGTKASHKSVVYSILKYYTQNPRYLELFSRKTKTATSMIIGNKVDLSTLLPELVNKLHEILATMNKLYIRNNVLVSRRRSGIVTGVDNYTEEVKGVKTLKLLDCNKLYADMSELFTDKGCVPLEQNTLDRIFKDKEIIDRVYGKVKDDPDMYYMRSGRLDEYGIHETGGSLGIKFENDIRKSVVGVHNVSINIICIALDIFLNVLLKEHCLVNKKGMKNILTCDTHDEICLLQPFTTYGRSGIYRLRRIIEMLLYMKDISVTKIMVDDYFTMLENELNYLANKVTWDAYGAVINPLKLAEIKDDIKTYKDLFTKLEEFGNTLYGAFFSGSIVEEYMKTVAGNEEDLNNMILGSSSLIVGKYEDLSPDFLEKILFSISSNIKLCALPTYRTDSLASFANRDRTPPEKRLPVFYITKAGRNNYLSSKKLLWMDNNFSFINWETSNRSLYDNLISPKLSALEDPLQEDLVTSETSLISPYNYIFQLIQYELSGIPWVMDYTKVIAKTAGYKSKLLLTLLFYLNTVTECKGDPRKWKGTRFSGFGLKISGS